MLKKLVSFDTVSKNSNMALIDFVKKLLLDQGINSRLISNEDGNKANLLATIGPNVEGGIVLSGHTDVVPVDGQLWSTNPFSMSERYGRLYGRGTCDMKGFIAVVLAALPKLCKSGLQIPVHLAFSYDEEVGCTGVRSMIDIIRQELPKPRAVIVGEPTDMKVVTAHKGVTGVLTRVTGREAHSSQPQLGVSAVMAASRCIEFLKGLGPRKNNNDPLFDPPHTTITVNRIDGGTALNILARQCDFYWDIRSLPHDEPTWYLDALQKFCDETLLPDLHRISPTCNVETHILAQTPALRHETNSDAEQLCRALTGDNQRRAVSYAAEAGQFQEIGLSTVICGPGSINQAHQPDEYLELSQLAAGSKFIDDLIGYIMKE